MNNTADFRSVFQSKDNDETQMCECLLRRQLVLTNFRCLDVHKTVALFSDNHMLGILLYKNDKEICNMKVVYFLLTRNLFIFEVWPWEKNFWTGTIFESFIIHSFCPLSPHPLPSWIFQNLLFWNALENMQFAQEHLKTIVYDNFHLEANKVNFGGFKNSES